MGNKVPIPLPAHSQRGLATSDEEGKYTPCSPRTLSTTEFSLAVQCLGLCLAAKSETHTHSHTQSEYKAWIEQWSESLALTDVCVYTHASPVARFFHTTTSSGGAENEWRAIVCGASLSPQSLCVLFGEDQTRYGPFAVCFPSARSPRESVSRNAPASPTHAHTHSHERESPKSPLHAPATQFIEETTSDSHCNVSSPRASPQPSHSSHISHTHSPHISVSLSVAAAKRVPCVCFRGLQTANEHLVDLHAMLPARFCASENARGDRTSGEAGLGFLRLYEELRENLRDYRNDANKSSNNGSNGDESHQETPTNHNTHGTFLEELERRLFSAQSHAHAVLLCGHGVGGALATLLAVELAFDPRFAYTRILLVTFGSPRCVDGTVASVLESMPNLRHFRFVNPGDFVTTTPLSIAGFSHFGHSVYPLSLNSSNVSPSVFSAITGDVFSFHKSEVTQEMCQEETDDSHRFQGWKWHVVYDPTQQSTRTQQTGRDFCTGKDLSLSIEHAHSLRSASHRLAAHTRYFGAMHWHDSLLFEKITSNWPVQLAKDHREEFVRSCVTSETSGSTQA